MEEQILKILRKYNIRYRGVAAKEIAKDVKDFAEWCIVNGYKVYPNSFYGICDSDLTFETIEPLENTISVFTSNIYEIFSIFFR